VRSLAQAKTLAQHISKLPALRLRGVEFYEGVIKGADQSQQIRLFVDECIAFTLLCRAEGLFAPGDILFSGAGSAWYDLVAEQIGAAGLAQTALATASCEQQVLPQHSGQQEPQLHLQQTQNPQKQQIVPLLRPGCYLFFDLGIYQQAQHQLLARSALACGVQGELQNALEVWAYVLSLPEPGLAVIGLGKRDIAFDAGFALVQQYYRPGEAAPVAADRRFVIEKMMDQHAILKIPPDADLAVGDMLSFAGSHPCLTLDKWRYLAVLDSDYQVRQLYPTFF
jgi:D-serine dehydratase